MDRGRLNAGALIMGGVAVGNAPSGHTLMQTWINKVALTLFADRVSVEATGVRPTMWAR